MAGAGGGATGATGAQGDQGLTGATGVQGAAGLTGEIKMTLQAPVISELQPATTKTVRATSKSRRNRLRLTSPDLHPAARRAGR